MTTIVLDDIDPKMLVSANQRIHWSRRAAVCAYWRARAAVNAVVLRRDDDELPYRFKVRVVITVRFPTNHRRDTPNLYPYVAKPLVDGLRDAGWLTDDSDAHLVGPDLRRDDENGPHRVTIRIEAAT